MEVKKIDFEKIKVDENQVRKDFDDDNNLAQSIIKNGLLQPLIVYKEGSFYRLVDGERRYNALRRIIMNDKLFCKQIDCTVIKKPSNITITQLITAIHKKSLNPIEEANAFKKLIEEHKFTIDDIVNTSGVNRNKIIDRLKLLGYDNKTQDEIKKGKLNATLAAKINLNKISNNPRLLQRVKNVGSNISEANELIAYSYKSTDRLLLILERRFRVLSEELERCLDTVIRIENSGIRIDSLRRIVENTLESVNGSSKEFEQVNKIMLSKQQDKLEVTHG